ncbi:RNA12 protein-domain-containing protein [Myxozyma melibiosi]|uniref:Mitochondrial escape protein 2 n=1 Tax=Myxozyma melibiosi TaxID=54550 RepID=A0ABR1EY33_9ASCO
MPLSRPRLRLFKLKFWAPYGTIRDKPTVGAFSPLRPLQLRPPLSLNSGSRRSFVIPYAKLVETTGLIEKADNEGLLYFDNIYPVRHNLWDFRQQILSIASKFESKNILAFMRENVIPEDLPISLSSVIPRPKDGGVIIKFTNHSSLPESEVEKRIQEHVENHTLRPWFNPFRTTRSFVVRGSPWIEDLHRFPSARVRVEFEGADVDQETLYLLFRRYGLIRDITPLSPAVKDLPRYATIQYVGLRSAASARNCLHGFVAPNGTKLHIYYDKALKKNMIREWFFGHPRIVIPALAALIAALTVAIFDPIRTFFIKRKITKSYSLTENKFFKYLKEQTTSALNAIMTNGGLGRYVRRQNAEMQIGFADRQDVVERLRFLISESPETFIVVQGPRGSGKVDLVREYVVKDGDNTLTIDCQRLVETRTEALFVKELSAQTGYFPVFPWMNSVSSFVDLVAQGLIGQKAGFSETLDAQFKKILENTDTAIKEIAVEAHKHAVGVVHPKNQNSVDACKTMDLIASEDVDESQSESRSEDFYIGTGIPRPVIVIEHFLHQRDKHETMYRTMAEWAAGLVAAKVAHVIFVTDDVGYSKLLQEAMPNTVYNTVNIGDAPPDLAKSFVRRQTMALPDTGTDREDTLKDLDKALEPLGGRMTDLLALIRRISIGETSLQAADEMIRQSSTEIIKRFLKCGSDIAWNPEQVWTIVKGLATAEDIRYNQLLADPLFKGNSDVIAALEHAELITVTERDGRPHAIKPGRPIYRAAFKRLIQDKGLYADQEITRLTSIVGVLSAGISKDEDELVKLSALFTPKGPAVDVSDRMRFLADDIQVRQKKISQCYKQIEEQKKVMAVVY